MWADPEIEADDVVAELRMLLPEAALLELGIAGFDFEGESLLDERLPDEAVGTAELL